MHNGPSQQIGPSEQTRCEGDITLFLQRPPDGRTADGVLSILLPGDHFNPETQFIAQLPDGLDRSLPVFSELVIISDHQFRYSDPLPQHLLNELTRSEKGEITIERDDHHLVNS